MNQILELLRKCFQPRQWSIEDGEPDPFVIADEDSFMWVYRENVKTGEYDVGYYSPDGDWTTDSSYSTRELAAARVNYLNGGKR